MLDRVVGYFFLRERCSYFIDDRYVTVLCYESEQVLVVVLKREMGSSLVFFHPHLRLSLEQRIITPPPYATFSSLHQSPRNRLCLCSATTSGDGEREGQEQQQQRSSGDRASSEPLSVVANMSQDEAALDTIDGKSQKGTLYDLLYPSKELLPDDKPMSVSEILEELRQRVFVSVFAVGAAMVGCFAFSKELIVLLEAPVTAQGVRFLQLSPGEFFFTTLKVAGYSGLLLGSPVILYEIIAFALPGLTIDERKFLGPIVFGSSILFYTGVAFSYAVLNPAALNFFVNYAEGAVESYWSIDQYFDFVLLLMFSTGLSFQVPVIQLLLGQTGLVTGSQMLSVWRYVVVGAVVAAAILTPSTDPLTQVLLAGPLMGLYLGGAWVVKLIGR